ncbi:hypothetical protein BGZ57DRAFT_890000, partial [Hyaloscypha finlandica]
MDVKGRFGYILANCGIGYRGRFSAWSWGILLCYVYVWDTDGSNTRCRLLFLFFCWVVGLGFGGC